MKLRDRFARFMYGRYGSDQFNKFLMYTELVCFIIAIILNMFSGWGRLFYWLCIACIVYMYFRMFSKNIYKRRKENETYLRISARVRDFFRGRSGKRGTRSSGSYGGRRGSEINYDDMFKIFRCPSCGQRIRVPRGKGRIRITCPKCKIQFIKKT